MNSHELLDGPDQVASANKIIVTNIRERVKLRIPDIGKDIETKAPISIPGILAKTVNNFPHHPALSYKTLDGSWKTITYRKYEEQVRMCAKAFIHLGLGRHNSVCILGFNSPEWFISSLAAIHAGGVSVGIYTTNSSAACLHCAVANETNIFIVQDSNQLQKILDIKDKLSHLKAIIQYEGAPEASDVLGWDDLLKIGKEQNEALLENRLKQIVVNECCMILFTSGTVGQPKAVMLSHDNIIWNSTVLAETLNMKKGEDHFISYLPLSHSAAQIADLYIPIITAGTTHFADKDALKGTLINTLKIVRPTYFLGVPRVWEKIQETITRIDGQNGFIKRLVSNWAKQQGYQYNINKLKGQSSQSWGYTLANWLVFKKVKLALGLDRCKATVCAAAPLSAETKKFFLSLNIHLAEAFGLTESSGPHTITLIEKFSLGGVGAPMPGTQTKIVESTGEICIYGRNVFMGYLGDPEKTSEAFDEVQWLRSGDIGCIDEDGILYITGRLKELIITAGGENISPVLIEQIVKQELPHVSNVMLIGDRRKYLCLLVTLKTEVDSEGKPSDILSAETKQWLQTLGCPARTLTDVLEAGPDSKLLKAIGEGIERTNAKAISRAQQIQKFVILPREFSMADGELGPTLKLKRNVVQEKFSDAIETLYTTE